MKVIFLTLFLIVPSFGLAKSKAKKVDIRQFAPKGLGGFHQQWLDGKSPKIMNGDRVLGEAHGESTREAADLFNKMRMEKANLESKKGHRGIASEDITTIQGSLIIPISGSLWRDINQHYRNLDNSMYQREK